LKTCEKKPTIVQGFQKMEEEDDFLVLSDGSEEDKDKKKKQRWVIRKTQSEEDEDKDEKEKNVEAATSSFLDGVFQTIDPRDGMEEDQSYLPPEHTIDVCLSESDLLLQDARPHFPPIPRQKNSLKASAFETKMLQAEREKPNDPETKRLRHIWVAYVALRDDYYNGSQPAEILTGSTSNFSTFDQFIATEAEEDNDGEGVEKTQEKKRPRGQPAITGYFNRVRGAPLREMFEQERDEYDFGDGFLVPDGQGEEEEEEEQAEDPLEMSAEERSSFQEKKRLKLATEKEKMQQDQEELRALRRQIKQRQEKIKNLTKLLEGCESLEEKENQEN